MNNLIRHLSSVFLLLFSLIHNEWAVAIQDSIKDVETIKQYVRDGFQENTALANDVVNVLKTDLSIVAGIEGVIPGLKPLTDSLSADFTPTENATPDEIENERAAWANGILEQLVSFLGKVPEQWQSLFYHGLVRNFVISRVKNDTAPDRVIDLAISIIFNHQTKPTKA